MKKICLTRRGALEKSQLSTINILLDSLTPILIAAIFCEHCDPCGMKSYVITVKRSSEN